MSEKTFKTSKEFGLAKAKFTFFKVVLELILTIYTLQFNGVHTIREFANNLCPINFETQTLESNRELIINSLFLLIINCILWTKTLPFKYYMLYHIQIKYGVKKNLKFTEFIKNNLKNFISSQIISMIMIIMLNVVINGRLPTYILLPSAMSAFKIISYFFTPFYYKKKPLEDKELEEKIQEMAKITKFPLKRIYIVYGLPKYTSCKIHYFLRNIYIFKHLLTKIEINYSDQIEKGFNNDEIVAIVAYELGSWKNSHDFSKLVLSHFQFVTIGLITKYFSERNDLFSTFAFGEIKSVFVGGLLIMQFILLPLTTIMVLVMNMYSHACVFKADSYVKELKYQKKLSKALIKLNVDNLRFPKYDWMYSYCYKSQPTPLQRLKRLAVKKDE